MYVWIREQFSLSRSIELRIIVLGSGPRRKREHSLCVGRMKGDGGTKKKKKKGDE